MIDQAAVIADVPIPADARDAILAALNQRVKDYEAIYKLNIPNRVAPALDFIPLWTPSPVPVAKRAPRLSTVPARGAPKNIEDLCFATIRQLADLMRRRVISSSALTGMYLDRLQRLDPN